MRNNNVVVNWVALLIIFGIIILFAIVGCNVEKHIAKEKVVVDSTAVKELQIVIDEKNTIIASQEKKIHELEYLGVIFKECPPAINVDSLRQVLIAGGCKQSTIDSLSNVLNKQKTIIKRLTDGSLEIQSNSIKELQFTKDRLEETISTLKSDNEKITKENESLKTELSKMQESKNEDVKKESGTGYMWLLFALGIIGGIIIDRKIFLNK